MFFVVRTDVSADSGSQRVFGGFDTEEAAAAYGIQLAGAMYGDFAVVGPAPLALRLVRDGGVQPVRAEAA